MPTLNGVAYTELFDRGSGRFTVSRDSGFRGDRFFRVAWDDKWTFLLGLLGGVEVLGDGTRIVTPAARFEAGSYYRAIDADTEPEFGRGVDAAGDAQYLNAVIHAVYGMPDYDEEDEEDPDAPLWIQGSAVARTEYLTIPGYALTWDSDDAPLDETVPAALAVTFVDYTFTRYNMAGFNAAAYEALMGFKVNSAAFLGRPAGTLRFGGYAPERTVNVLGEYSGVNLTIHLLYREIEWVKFFRPNVGWAAVDCNAVPLFTPTDFGAVL